MRRGLVVVALVLAGTALAAGVITYRKTGVPGMESIDWKSLEFRCTRKEDHWPKLDPEADEWFKTARAYEKRDLPSLDTEMVRLYKLAAERNHFKAMINLALLYQHGYNGVPRSESKAVELVERLIKMNIGAGYYMMGTYLEQGVGVRVDRAAALTYFRKSADLGEPQGQVRSADKLAEAVARLPAEERTRGYAIARSMYQCALSQGYAEGGYRLGMHLAISENQSQAALEAFQASARLGYGHSLWELHSIFRDGDYGIPKDPDRAECYRRLSKENDNDKSKTFPDLDRICPLPPAPMPR